MYSFGKKEEQGTYSATHTPLAPLLSPPDIVGDGTAGGKAVEYLSMTLSEKPIRSRLVTPPWLWGCSGAGPVPYTPKGRPLDLPGSTLFENIPDPKKKTKKTTFENV